MRRKFLFPGPGSILMLVLLAAPIRSQQPLKSAYDVLLERVKGGDTAIDFQELRRAFTATSKFDPHGPDPGFQKVMFAALDERDYAKALEAADKILTDSYVDINAHYVSSLAYAALHNPAKAKLHHDIAIGLISSILKSGDGKSPETAFLVIDRNEEDVVLKVLGLKPGPSSRLQIKGHSYDHLEATDSQSDRTASFYFNVDNLLAGREDVIKR